MLSVFAVFVLAGSAVHSHQTVPADAPATKPHAINPLEWVSTGYYPSEAKRRGEEGRAAFLVTVSTAGRVKHCQITASSGSQSLDEGTCYILRKVARFKPARDAAGNKVDGEFSSQLNWTLLK